VLVGRGETILRHRHLPAAALLQPGEAVELHEVGAELVAQGEEVEHIHRGVVEHVAVERALRPVGLLVVLVELDAEVGLEERGEAVVPNYPDRSRYSVRSTKSLSDPPQPGHHSNPR